MINLQNKELAKGKRERERSIDLLLKYGLCIILIFPGGSNSKDSACNAGDPGSIPGLRRSLGEGNDYPLQYSCLENSMDRGAWLQSMRWQKSQTQLSTHTLGYYINSLSHKSEKDGHPRWWREQSVLLTLLLCFQNSLAIFKNSNYYLIFCRS